MDIKQMKYFIAVCETGSISRAAKSMYISQQGMSSSLHRLEQEIRCPLFFRKGNTLVITKEGQYFLETSKKIIANYDELCAHFNVREANDTTIAVACVYNILLKFPNFFRQEFLKKKDDYKLFLTECYSTEVPSMLSIDNCAFALTYDMSYGNAFNKIYFRSIRHGFLVHKDHPLAQYDIIEPAQLNGARMILPNERVAVRLDINQFLKKNNLSISVEYESTLFLQIQELIRNDHSLVAHLTEVDAANVSPDEFHFLMVRDEDFANPVVLVYKKNKTLSTAERAFLKDMKALSQRLRREDEKGANE